ncbi:MAG: hypothetical protein ACWGNV_09955, partial [Bacteroidales bacterium]
MKKFLSERFLFKQLNIYIVWNYRTMQKYTGAVLPGKPYPLGATFDGLGVNFALFSENATGIKLCLFGRSEEQGKVGEVQVKEVT